MHAGLRPEQNVVRLTIEADDDRVRAEVEQITSVCGSAQTPERAVVYCSRMYRAEQTAEGLRVFGEIDIAAADDFAHSLVDAFQSASGTVVVDLSAIEFFDSSGVGAILTSVQTLGGSWLVETSPFVFKVLNLVGITSGQVANLQVRPPKQRGH